MSEKSMYDRIKTLKGERFAKAIRNYDNGIFDIPNLEEIVRYAGDGAEPIMNVLISLKDVRIEETERKESPFALLEKAGYRAEHADTLKKQNSIEKYFAPGEGLCTFKDSSRYKMYHIINAVRMNAEKIRRDAVPKREDAYGTSVMSIQILKEGGFIKITNRYNHTVENPDNTYSSNPDNIIPGLSASLKDHFNVDFSSRKTPLPEGYAEIDRKIVKYNFERNGVYFGDRFYCKDGRIVPLNSHEIMLDYLVLDLKTKKISNPAEIKDGFIPAIEKELENQKVTFSKEGDYRKLQAENGFSAVLDGAKIVSLHMPTLTAAGDDFFSAGNSLKEFSAPKLRTAGNNFLFCSPLTELSVPELTTAGDGFLHLNNSLTKFSAPKLTTIGNDFLPGNKSLVEFSAPELKTAGKSFLCLNKSLREFSAPKLTAAGDNFLRDNASLTEFSAPELTAAGDDFLHFNKSLAEFSAPKLTAAGKSFLAGNESLTEFSAPELKTAGEGFLYCNNSLTEFSVPKLTAVGKNFLRLNTSLTEFSAPKLRTAGEGFLADNESLREFSEALLQKNAQARRGFSPLKRLLGRFF